MKIKFLMVSAIVMATACLIFAQIWECAISKRAGEIITISWDYPADAPIDGFVIYRQTSLTAVPAKIASLAASARQLQIAMPSGSTQQYRFRVMAVKGSSISPAGIEIVVNRKK